VIKEGRNTKETRRERQKKAEPEVRCIQRKKREISQKEKKTLFSLYHIYFKATVPGC
jgi:parvulin-like peptidyl-prolyl isomerase